MDRYETTDQADDVKRYMGLDKRDLLVLIRGSQPARSAMSNPVIWGNGRLDARSGLWKWNVWELAERYDKAALIRIYLICKGSWQDEAHDIP